MNKKKNDLITAAECKRLYDALEPKQKSFVNEFLIDNNGTAAAIRSGYSPKSAATSAHNNLKHKIISSIIKYKLWQQSIRTEVTADKVLQELARIAFSDVRGLFDQNGNIISPDQWDDRLSAAVSSIQVVKNNSTEDEHIHKISFWNKNDALEKIAKHFGMIIERTQILDADGNAVTITSTMTEKEAEEAYQKTLNDG